MLGTKATKFTKKPELKGLIPSDYDICLLILVAIRNEEEKNTMRRLITICLFLFFGSAMSANADWIYSYETDKCINQIGFHEWSRLDS